MPEETQLKAAAKDVTEKAKAAAKDAAETIKDQAYSQAAEAKENVAGEVRSVASALRTASDEMRSGSPQERAMGQIAETLADVSDAIRDKDLGDMVTSASDFARRNPIAFLGGAALLGFAAARFAKASGGGTDASEYRTQAPVSTNNLSRNETVAQPVKAYQGEPT